MVVTALKAQVKNPSRVSVFVDSKYSFSLHQLQVLELKIRVGQTIDDPMLSQFKQQSDFGRAYERAINYISIRPRSHSEMKQYLQRKGLNTLDSDKIIQKLQQRGYLNDEVFAKLWVQARALNKNISRRKLLAELNQKGIAGSLAEQAIAGEEYDEITALKKLIAKKLKIARFANDQQKLMQYLARQGFRFDDIKSAQENTN